MNSNRKTIVALLILGLVGLTRGNLSPIDALVNESSIGVRAQHYINLHNALLDLEKVPKCQRQTKDYAKVYAVSMAILAIVEENRNCSLLDSDMASRFTKAAKKLSENVKADDPPYMCTMPDSDNCTVAQVDEEGMVSDAILVPKHTCKLSNFRCEKGEIPAEDDDMYCMDENLMQPCRESHFLRDESRGLCNCDFGQYRLLLLMKANSCGDGFCDCQISNRACQCKEAYAFCEQRRRENMKAKAIQQSVELSLNGSADMPCLDLGIDLSGNCSLGDVLPLLDVNFTLLESAPLAPLNVSDVNTSLFSISTSIDLAQINASLSLIGNATEDSL